MLDKRFSLPGVPGLALKKMDGWIVDMVQRSDGSFKRLTDRLSA